MCSIIHGESFSSHEDEWGGRGIETERREESAAWRQLRREREQSEPKGSPCHSRPFPSPLALLLGRYVLGLCVLSSLRLQRTLHSLVLGVKLRLWHFEILCLCDLERLGRTSLLPSLSASSAAHQGLFVVTLIFCN